MSIYFHDSYLPNLYRLIETDPKGLICGHCKQINDFHDEEWFYVDTIENPDIQLPCCSRCWNSEVGITFRKKHGKFAFGER